MKGPSEGTWLIDLIEVYNQLGGQAAYKDVYPVAEKVRKDRGASWTRQARASIRRTVEDHAESSKNFRGKSVFYSVNGHGSGTWGLLPSYLNSTANNSLAECRYQVGLEGILSEAVYLRRSRDPKLKEARKLIDNFRCQACGYRKEISVGYYNIEVHHLYPLSQGKKPSLNSTEDLICLCPNCHRIAHSRRESPLSIDEIRLISSNTL